MKKSINPCLVLGALLVAACFAVKVSAGEPTIWTKIQSNPETTVFAGYANELGLVDALDTQDLVIPWTIFVPNNDAFARLPAKMKQKLANDDKFKRRIITSHMVLGAPKTMWEVIIRRLNLSSFASFCFILAGNLANASLFGTNIVQGITRSCVSRASTRPNSFAYPANTVVSGLD